MFTDCSDLHESNRPCKALLCKITGQCQRVSAQNMKKENARSGQQKTDHDKTVSRTITQKLQFLFFYKVDMSSIYLAWSHKRQYRSVKSLKCYIKG